MIALYFRWALMGEEQIDSVTAEQVRDGIVGDISQRMIIGVALAALDAAGARDEQARWGPRLPTGGQQAKVPGGIDTRELVERNGGLGKAGREDAFEVREAFMVAADHDDRATQAQPAL